MSGQFDPSLPSPAESSDIERRVATRYAIDLSTSVRLRATMYAGSVRVRNLSSTGISLIVPEHVAPGTHLTLELRNVLRQTSRTVQVHVVYCIDHPSGELILGGRFTEPLGEEELKLFIR